MPRRLAASLFLLASCLPGAALAQTTWVCSLSHDLVRLVCLADDAPGDAAAAASAVTAAAAPAVTATVNGTRFPLDPRRLWTVELWSPATEPERVAELARATICYRSPGCSVVMSGPLARR